MNNMFYRIKGFGSAISNLLNYDENYVWLISEKSDMDTENYAQALITETSLRSTVPVYLGVAAGKSMMKKDRSSLCNDIHKSFQLSKLEIENGKKSTSKQISKK